MSRAALFAAAAVLLTPAVSPAKSAQAVAMWVEPARLANLPAFIDGVMAQQLATREVAGAVVIVVYRGKVLFSRGYGFADIARRVAVDPQRTLFRPGSVSKLFTWVALMQQVEAGRVDLDADVNRYIDFTIPTYAGNPIRVRDLLSHSPGLSDVGGFKVDDVSKLVRYSDWLKTHLPPRVRAAGTEISYSNYGASLAGYIVERASGEPFDTYADRHVFAPLGMRTTTFREPLPPAWRDAMATGYAFTDGAFTAKPFELVSPVMPAGSISATAVDMARFMLAMLNDGAIGPARILTPKSVALLESNSLFNGPRLPGMAHGFMVVREAGPRLVGHGGDTGDFHSDLILAPEAALGLFTSFTGGANASWARTELSEAIIGRLFPQVPAPRWTGTEPLPPMGAYRSNRRDYRKPADPTYDLQVSSAGPHRVVVETRGKKTMWEQIGPRLYEQVTGAREGGPYDRLEFYGTADDPRLAFATQEHVTFHLAPPPEGPVK